MTKQRRRTKPTTQSKSPISPVMIGVIVVAAVLVVGGLILLGNQQSNSVASGPVEVSEFPTLGDPNAPVTMIEYSDYG